MTALALLLIELSAAFSAGSIPLPLDQMLRVDKMTEDDFSMDMDRLRHASGSLMDNTAGEAAEVAAEHTPTSEEAKKIENLRFSGIRLQTIAVEDDALRPWVQAGQEATFVGSGFVVRNSKDKGPLVVTNSHVVTGATRLTIQVPAAGQQSYKARVVLNNPDMDIALVELESAKEHRAMRKDVGFELPTIKLFKGKAKVGEPVMTMGFPLGQNSVKVSKGVLSGHEKVGDFMAYQQTAPISPGNSGGPLFKDGTTQVLGINFAAAVGDSSQNNNYAIPSWHVMQMLHEYDATSGLHIPAGETGYSQFMCRQDHKYCTYRVPRMKAQASEGNDGLYERYGCEAGIFVSKIEDGSMANSAEPPIPPKSFIMSIDGNKIDKFGMTKSDMYFGDPIMFTDLMFMSPKLAPVDVEVCTCGETTTHKVHVSALDVTSEPESPIRDGIEPSLEAVDYEQFGGVTVQPLSMNVIKQLAQGPMKRMDMLRFVVTKKKKPALVVTAVSKINDATGSINVGDIVHTVNGKKAATMAEFRAAFEPTGHEADDADSLMQKGHGTCSSGHEMWTLETTTGKELAQDYSEAMKEQRAAVLKGEKPLTPAVKMAMKKMSHATGFPATAPASAAETKVTPAAEPLPIEARTGVSRGGVTDFDALSLFRSAAM